MQIMSVRGTMISRVSVSESMSTLRSICETSGSNRLLSTSRSIAALPCSSWTFSSSSSSDSSEARRLCCRSSASRLRMNGVRCVATEASVACLSMISSGLLEPAVRGRISTETTAMMSAAPTPDTNCAQNG